MPQHRVAEIGEQRAAETKQHGDKCDIRPGAAYRAWISRVDVAADLTVTNGGHHNHRPAEEKEQQAADIADQLVRRRGHPSTEGSRCNLEKKIKFFNEEAERHYGDGGPNPAQIGPLVRRMIGKPVDQIRAAGGRSVAPAAASARIVIL